MREIPDSLDTLTCLRLGEALFRVLAGISDDPDAADLDTVSWEDAGAHVDAFVVLDYDTAARVQEVIEEMQSHASDSPASVSPEQTPSPAADSAHRGDQCTVGEGGE